MNNISAHENFIFLLGGHDLEMAEIRKILDIKGIKYFDHNLEWGAKLSSYTSIFDEEHTFVGIELGVDCPLPSHYIEIDHHNEKEPLPSSLQQLAKRLDFDVTGRYYQLVIQNDIGHIMGMRHICATDDEISKIRFADRKAQGIPEEWINTAKEESEDALYNKDVAIIKTTLEKTSVICDVFSHTKLIVYNETGLNYYGIGAIEILKNHYSELFQNIPTHVYSGGAYDGYFGITKEGLIHKPVDRWIKEIVELTGSDLNYSTHSFMLPLKWDYLAEKVTKKEPKENISFDKRTDLSQFNCIVNNPDNKWRRILFNIGGKAENYNEYTYFHEYVRKVMFDIAMPPEEDINIVSDDKIMLYYEIKTEENDYYEIHTPKIVYRLKLTSISMHVFTTGILILTYNMVNTNYPHKEDILFINEFGRHIYPQFLTNSLIPTQAVKDTFLACKISVQLNGEIITEDFKNYNDWNKLKTPAWENNNYKFNSTISPPAFVTHLFQNGFVFTNDNEIDRKGIIRLSRVTDDRMFFQSWYGNNYLADELKVLCNYTDKQEYAYATHPYWYAFLFGDKKWPSVENDLMMFDHLRKHSYTRWIKLGTCFGFTRDSFVCISSDQPTLKKYHAPDLNIHMQTMYYQLAVLCLAQRTSILRFSAEVTKLNDLSLYKSKDKKITDKIKLIYLNYIEFINKIYFREVTSQVQGIEMYSQLQEIMNINHDVKNLDTEVEELNRFASYLEQEKQAKEAQSLTLLATLFLPAGLIAALVGMNIKDFAFESFTLEPLWPFWYIVFLSIFISIITILVVKPLTYLLARINGLPSFICKIFKKKK